MTDVSDGGPASEPGKCHTDTMVISTLEVPPQVTASAPSVPSTALLTDQYAVTMLRAALADGTTVEEVEESLDASYRARLW